MNIFYLKITELLKKYPEEEILTYSDTNKISSKERLLQHCTGRFLVQNVLKKIYNMQKPQIITRNKKPQLTDNKINFSLAHSGDIVIVAFDNYPCGIDLEYMRPVNLEGMSKRYNKNFISLEDFYKFWTNYEASIKLGSTGEFEYNLIFQNEYYLTLLSASKMSSTPVFIDFLNYIKNC